MNNELIKLYKNNNELSNSISLYVENIKYKENVGEHKKNTIISLLIKFKEKIENTNLPPLVENWYFNYKILEDRITLSLIFIKDNKIAEEFILFNVKCNYLSVEAYAQKYNVSVTTVRQWIRRGKIRSAKKVGRNWLIPELTDEISRGFKPVIYFWDLLPDNLVESFPYLKECDSIKIVQDSYCKKIYNIYLNNEKAKTVNKILSKNEVEKLELALISEPNIKFRNLS